MSLKERFGAAPTLTEFTATADTHVDLWKSIHRRARVPDDLLLRARSLPEARHLLVLLEDWCLDAVNTVPVLDRLAEAVPGIDLRVLERDGNPDLMDSHLTGSSRSIPVVMALDSAFDELGWWGPRPTSIQDWFMREGRHADEHDRVRDMRRMYARDRGRTTLEEVMALLEHGTRVEVV